MGWVQLTPQHSVWLTVRMKMVQAAFKPFMSLTICKQVTTVLTSTKTAMLLEIATCLIRGGADKSLARPGIKQTRATKLGIYSTYSQRSSIDFLARCSKFCKPLKRKSECCPSNQVSAAATTYASDEKWRPFNCFLNPGNRW